jgi:hypothetical protein
MPAGGGKGTKVEAWTAYCYSLRTTNQSVSVVFFLVYARSVLRVHSLFPRSLFSWMFSFSQRALGWYSSLFVYRHILLSVMSYKFATLCVQFSFKKRLF